MYDLSIVFIGILMFKFSLQTLPTWFSTAASSLADKVSSACIISFLKSKLRNPWIKTVPRLKTLTNFCLFTVNKIQSAEFLKCVIPLLIFMNQISLNMSEEDYLNSKQYRKNK